MATNAPRRRRVVDPQKQRLYDSEAVLVAHSKRYPEVRDVQVYVDSVLARKMVREEFLARPITVLDGRGRRSGCALVGRRAIKLPRSTRTTYYILHEVAHVLVASALRRGESKLDRTPHGPIFVGAYLMLVDEFMGMTAGREFRESLREHRVDWASWVRA